MPLVDAEKMREVADMVKEQLPGKKVALIVLDLDAGNNQFNYIGNAKREDLAAAFQSLMHQWENKNPVTG